MRLILDATYKEPCTYAGFFIAQNAPKPPPACPIQKPQNPQKNTVHWNNDLLNQTGIFWEVL